MAERIVAELRTLTAQALPVRLSEPSDALEAIADL